MKPSKVAEGTYAEDLVIPDTKTNLELVGATGAIIKGVGVGPGPDFPYTVPNIDILADGVTIHGFTIESPDAVVDKYASGLLIGASGVEIYENAFKVHTQAGGQYSVVIQTWRKVVIGFEAVDISGLNIHDNTFDDIGDGAVGYDGIYVNIDTGTGPISICDNKFTGSLFRAIDVERSNVLTDNNSIITDLAPGPGYQGIYIGCWELNVGEADGPVQSNVVITRNTVKGSDEGLGFNQGIRIGHSSQQLGLEDITVSQNTVEGNNEGIAVKLDASAVSVNYNSIVSRNVDFGVKNYDVAHILNAKNNWWGDPTGADHLDNPHGTEQGGSVVNDNVDFIPWYATGTTTPDTEYVSVDHTVSSIIALSDTIQGGIDAALSGDTISVAAGIYSEWQDVSDFGAGKSTGIMINKSLTLLGANHGVPVTEEGERGPESIIDAQEAKMGVLINGEGTIATFDGFTVEIYDIAGILS